MQAVSILALLLAVSIYVKKYVHHPARCTDFVLKVQVAANEDTQDHEGQQCRMVRFLMVIIGGVQLNRRSLPFMPVTVNIRLKIAQVSCLKNRSVHAFSKVRELWTLAGSAVGMT